MSSQLPHRHKCQMCGVLITTDCECPDKRAFAELCDRCYDIEADSEGELEF